MVAAQVLELHPAGSIPREAAAASAKLSAYLDRCALAPNTVAAYRRQVSVFVEWLTAPGVDHEDAFVDEVGAQAAMSGFRAQLLRRATASTVNQALAAVGLLYEHCFGWRVQVKRARVRLAGEPDSLSRAKQGAVERASLRRGVRDGAVVAVMLYTGARVEEAARLWIPRDLALTARTGRVRLLGKGEQLREVPVPAVARERLGAWLRLRGSEPGPLWLGQRGPLTVSGLTQIVLAVGADAGVPGLRPHRLRHTFATRLRQAGVDVAQVQYLLGHADIRTSSRYFRPGEEEQAAAIESAFGEV